MAVNTDSLDLRQTSFARNYDGTTFDADTSAPSETSYKRKLWCLNAFAINGPGHLTPGLWKHPDDCSSNYHDIEYWTKLAVLLEKGKFHSLFLADVLGSYDAFANNHSAATAAGAQFGADDPSFAIAVAATATQNLAFGITQNVNYDTPFNIARKFATLDHLTKGRVAINIVTSLFPSAVANQGLDVVQDGTERYHRADEFVDVLYKLWESSWADDAVVRDVSRDLYADPSKVRTIDHVGKYFRVKGPAASEPSKQRTPLLFQAGSSSAGISFAAKHAECVFVAGPSTRMIRGQVDQIRQQAKQNGRSPAHIRFIMSMTVFVAETDSAAEAKFQQVKSLASRQGALALVSGWLGQDLSIYGDEADLRDEDNITIRNVANGYSKLYPGQSKWTKYDLAEYAKVGGLGYPPVIGSAKTVADHLERVVQEADVDGFSKSAFRKVFPEAGHRVLKQVVATDFAYHITPQTYEDLVTHLIPELQARGVHWRDYPARELTARELFYGSGNSRLLADHYGSRYKWQAGREAPKLD